MPGNGVAAELAYAEEADRNVQVRGCEEGKALDDVFGLCVAGGQGDRGGVADRGLEDDARCGGGEVCTDAAGDGEGFSAAGMS